MDIWKFTAHESPHSAWEYCDCHPCQMMWTFLINIEKAKIGSQMIPLLRGFQHRLFRIYATQILYGLVASDRFHFNETSWIHCPFSSIKTLGYPISCFFKIISITISSFPNSTSGQATRQHLHRCHEEGDRPWGWKWMEPWWFFCFTQMGSLKNSFPKRMNMEPIWPMTHQKSGFVWGAGKFLRDLGIK